MDNQTERAMVDLAKAQLMAAGYRGEDPKSILGRINAYQQNKVSIKPDTLAKEIARYQISVEIWKKPEIKKLDNFDAFIAVIKKEAK